MRQRPVRLESPAGDQARGPSRRDKVQRPRSPDIAGRGVAVPAPPRAQMRSRRDRLQPDRPAHLAYAEAGESVARRRQDRTAAASATDSTRSAASERRPRRDAGEATVPTAW